MERIAGALERIADSYERKTKREIDAGLIVSTVLRTGNQTDPSPGRPKLVPDEPGVLPK
jgi:hypothetical protein